MSTQPGQPPQQYDALSDSMPDPASTPGLEAGGGVPAGETPPGEGSMSGAVTNREQTVNQGPVSGNRTPMFITLGILGVLVLMVFVLVVARAVA